jgi:molecular chaperone DnaK (HSP70)
MTSGYLVGIDLGTSHTVVAYARKGGGAGPGAVRLLEIEQLVAPGEVAARALLPSLRYHPAPGELPTGDLVLPWAPTPDAETAVIGTLARALGAKVPGRLVASAKSWLSHGAVDRLAGILPWGGPAGVPKVSPVAASASYLAHVRAAWNQRLPHAPLEHQALVLTVPASFDEAARALTLQAARDAGLPTLRLLEEPQAALYDWLFRHRKALPRLLADTRLVLVCDVGGGTTDLSLVRVDAQGGEPRLERVAVGRHLMLGGDNMDLALAHIAESKLDAQAEGAAASLSPGQLAQLVDRCRAAKERLLAREAPDSATVTLVGGGARMVGGARSVELRRDEVEHIVVEGFFPQGAADEFPKSQRGSALVAFGLPYASDPAVTRHVAAFLHQHHEAGWPDAVLLNGGVFKADALAQRLCATLGAWRGAAMRTLHNQDPDIAVARGAVAYELARRGLAPRIGGGSPRSYFLLLENGAETGGEKVGEKPAVCILPRGSDEGHELRLEERSFVLRTGQPVRFHLATTTAELPGHAALRPGDVVDLAASDAQPLPPVATVVRAETGTAAPRDIRVQLATTLTEVGTLEVDCIAADDETRRWKLEFQLHGEGAARSTRSSLPRQFPQAVEAIERVFGARKRDVSPREVKQLRARLESLLGERERWTAALLRPLFDALWRGVRGRRRSADHERVWLSLAGWCLRPGFGDSLDGWRIEQLWPIFEQGVQHASDPQVRGEWWTLWRRVAGGLGEDAQQRLLDDFAINLRGHEADIGERPPRLVKGSWDDMVRLAASLERIPAEFKVEIGDWLVAQLRGAAAKTRNDAHSVWTLWAIGRLGARVPLYGSAHAVVPAESATAWLDALLELDWKRTDGAAAVANLARLSGDRARDLPLDTRERVVARLRSVNAPASWIARIQNVESLDVAAETGVFGEALPPGLKLIE